MHLEYANLQVTVSGMHIDAFVMVWVVLSVSFRDNVSVIRLVSGRKRGDGSTGGTRM